MPLHMHRQTSNTPTSTLPWPREANSIITTTPVKIASIHSSPISAKERKRSKTMNISTLSSEKSSRRGKSSSSISRLDSRFQQQHDQMMSRQQFRTNTSNSRGSNHRHTRDGSTGKRSSANSLQGTESYESGYSQMSRRSQNAPSKFIEVKGENNHQRLINGVKDIIEDLNKAIGHERRKAAISNACAEFDHWDTEKHNIELQLGCSNVLSLVLSMTEDTTEIRMLCAALEMVYRASTEVVRKSFQDVGPDMVPLLLKLLERCETDVEKHSEVSVLNISKILLYFSRVAELRPILARHQDMLETLSRASSARLNPDARAMRVRILANLANADDNKDILHSHPGLLDCILKIAAIDTTDTAREYSAACLMDIASSPISQVSMAANDKVLAVLVKLSVQDDKEETREYAVTAMQNLAFAKENRIRLATFTQGVVLEALKKALSTDQNDKTRRRAAGAITNLACDETAHIIGGHSGLIDILSRVATHDKNDDVQKRSSLALTKIASSWCPEEDKLYEKLIASLINTACSPNSTGIAAVLRVKARDASKRETLARLPGLLETLADMSTSQGYSSKDKDNAMRAIMHLTNEHENRKLMCNKVILKALVEASKLEGVENTETRDSAIVAIERLATEVSNRQYMARHDGLLVAIAQATERESKSELAGEKNVQPRLAKQLLMSLLLAM